MQCRPIALAALAGFFAAQAVAGPLEDAQAAHDAGDYATALRLFETLAEEGDAEAEFWLGDMYLSGDGVPQDNAQALMWLGRSAEHGKTVAGWLLGQVYDGGLQHLGIDVPEDTALAVEWYATAAEAGFEAAWYQLAEHYDEGRGVAQDYGEAARWYGKLAAAGDVVSENRLGEIYRAGGPGLPQDPARAVAWFAKAAWQGYGDAQLNLGQMFGAGEGVRRSDVQAYLWLSLAISGFPSDADRHDRALAARDLVAARMTPEQIGAAQDLIAGWQPMN